ncbi:hypothetical protein SLEP1_g32398 [Rubroshorea leprosula]|uniref:Uncharacterized protein n=1 Tax=Rubroshorea leprosula TaxID=152421 RepID=A0AAV5KD84_9ROSI|nr:hypothetical protein SLEP1_g32398 [Rubroshorea leprosula]
MGFDLLSCSIFLASTYRTANNIHNFPLFLKVPQIFNMEGTTSISGLHWGA